MHFKAPLAAAVLAAVVAACAAPAKSPPNNAAGSTSAADAAAPETTTSTSTDSATPPEQPQAASLAPEEDTPAPTTTSTTAPPPKPPARIVIPDVEASELMGMDGGALMALLGPPDLKRQEPPAEVWQYRAETCVFDLVLYTKGESGGDARVTYLEARDREARPAAAPACLNAVLRARAG